MPQQVLVPALTFLNAALLENKIQPTFFYVDAENDALLKHNQCANNSSIIRQSISGNLLEELEHESAALQGK